MVKKIIFSLIPFIAVALFTSEQYSDNGRAGYTGAPGENTCASSGCHTSFALNSGGGSVTSSCSMMNNWQYEPGLTYTINVTVTRTGTNLFGIGVECLTSTGANAGTLIITDAAHTQIKTRTVSSVVRRDVVHQLNGGVASGYKVFTFNWTAPATNIGNVTFYYAGNAANGNGNESGDYIYTGSQVVTPLTTTGITQVDPVSVLSVYPNPVAEQLHIDYTLKNSGKVQIRLFDMNGKMIREFVNRDQQAGTYSESFPDMQNYPGGVYFVQSLVDGVSQTKKILVQ